MALQIGAQLVAADQHQIAGERAIDLRQLGDAGRPEARRTLAALRFVEKLLQAVETLKAIGKEIEGTDGEPAAGVASLGEYSYKVTFVFYVKKGADYLGTINAVNLEVLKRFEQAGIALALPTRTIVNG